MPVVRVQPLDEVVVMVTSADRLKIPVKKEIASVRKMAERWDKLESSLQSRDLREKKEVDQLSFDIVVNGRIPN